MLIDDVSIKIKAGNGGRGAVAFNNIKMALGPTGADGGKGGSVFFEGVSDLGALNQFRYRKELKAQKGGNGKSQFNDGADGEDLTLKVPAGTVIHNLTTGLDFEITSIGQKILAAKGGQGGKGNFKFRSSVNTTPEEFQEGLPGQEFELRLELKLIADVGFVGLPNAGKSSLLNELTNAKSKVANYPFTTLDPNLGAYYELILADIPGIIEGASDGKGLGIKFLRHIERTKTIFHFISAESSDPLKDYNIIRAELGAYNKELLEKKEYIFLTKIDLLEKFEVEKRIKTLRTLNPNVSGISIETPSGINKAQEILNKIKDEKISR